MIIRVATPFKHVWFPLFFIKLSGHSFLNTRKRESAVKLFRQSYVYFHSVNVAGLCLTIPGKLWHTTEMWWWGAHAAHHSASLSLIHLAPAPEVCWALPSSDQTSSAGAGAGLCIITDWARCRPRPSEGGDLLSAVNTQPLNKTCKHWTHHGVRF